MHLLTSGIRWEILLCGFLILGCLDKPPASSITDKQVKFDQLLADELKRMAEVDQIAAYIPQGRYTKLSEDQWHSFKDSVFTTHQKRLEVMFEKHGFVGFDMAGEEGSNNFWLMVQHSDHDPEFQQAVLEQMKRAVDQGNADPSTYGLLVDRVNLNTGQQQIYGTQVDYKTDICQAFSKNLAEPKTVNERRQAIGLEPLESYLNSMTQSHFEMNKEYYQNKGITGPTLYDNP